MKKPKVVKPLSKKSKKNVEVFDDNVFDNKPKEKTIKELPEPPALFKKDDKKVDKIFGNDFNTGNLDSEKFPDIQIEFGYASSILDDCYNTEDYNEKKELLQLTVDVFTKSQWGNLSLEKKFSKELQPFIFNDLYKGMEGKGYTSIDIFICIAEFMDVSYERIYEIAGLKMKEQLINELESKYKTLSRKKINRLF